MAAGARVALIGVLQDFLWWTPFLRSLGLPVSEIAVARAVASAVPLTLEDLAAADTIRFGDPHTVEPFARALRASDRDLRSLARLRFEGADQPTLSALRRCGIRPDPPSPTPGRVLRLTGPGRAPRAGERMVYSLEPLPLDPEWLDCALAGSAGRIFTSSEAHRRFRQRFDRPLRRAPQEINQTETR
jgi:uroporphyrinogen-III synthase